MTDQRTSSMRDRIAGQALIEKTLAEQAAVRPRNWLARVFGLTPLSDAAWPWYAGARGEIELGRTLRRLPPEWTTFHSLPIGNDETDIDHVIVGPGGVFTINTKSHRGKNVRVAGRSMLVSGQTKPCYIPAAEREAGKVTALLRGRMPDIPPTRPLIAIVATSKLTIKSKPQQVAVLEATHLTCWLRKQRTALSPEQRVLAVSVLDDPTLWPSRPAPAVTDSLARFVALEREVLGASVVRATWKLAGIGVIVWAGTTALPALVMSLLP